MKTSMKQIQVVLITGVEVVLHGPIPCQKLINSDLNAWNYFIVYTVLRWRLLWSFTAIK